MNIEEKAFKFAVDAHKGQIRKSEPEKPMVIHPIYVANLLRLYGFNSNVIAAGYLHDTVEDTIVTIEDIENNFGPIIRSLVEGNTEPDKNDTWENRKKHTIETIKSLDLDHKAIVCCDKISNLEDLMIKSEINGGYDFSSFNRGFDKQKWYYDSIYESLITNEDKSYAMFKRYRLLLDHIFYNIDELELNIKDYNKLKLLHYMKKEVYKLNNVITNKKPYVIEFTGTPRTGKTTIINNLYDFFKKAGFNVLIVEEFTTSKYYKENIKPLLKDKYVSIVNQTIPEYVLKDIDNAIDKNPDIILIDRSLFDRTIWMDRIYQKGLITKEELDEYTNKYMPLINDKINIIISSYVDSSKALERDYMSNLYIEKRNFLNSENLDEYNTSLDNMIKLANDNNINIYSFDTNHINIRNRSIKIASTIIKDMKKVYMNEINKEYR